MTTKYVLKQAARGLIPDRIIDKPKIGFFAASVDRWFSAQTDGVIADYLLAPSPRYAEFIDRSTVERLVSARERHGRQPWAAPPLTADARDLARGVPPARPPQRCGPPALVLDERDATALRGRHAGAGRGENLRPARRRASRHRPSSRRAGSSSTPARRTAPRLVACARGRASLDRVSRHSRAHATEPSGRPIVRAFEAGVRRARPPADVIVKLDADVSMDATYFERLLDAFAADPDARDCQRLAPRSSSDGVWRPRHNTGSSVWGAARAYRAECLADVRPLEERMGWDGIDELKARVRGWTTRDDDRPPFPASPAGRGSRRLALAGVGGTRPGIALHGLSRLVPPCSDAAPHRTERAALGMVWGFAARAAARRPVCSDADVRGRLRQEQRLRNLSARRREAMGAQGTDEPRRRRVDVLLVCTAGGHLLQLWSLRAAWSGPCACLGRREPRGQRRAVAARGRPRLLRALAGEPQPEESRAQPVARPAAPRSFNRRSS